MVAQTAVDQLDDSQLSILEAEVARQDDAMKTRVAGVGTRATILIAASGVLGGTTLVTSSGNILISAASLVLYLVAAVCGLLSMRSTVGNETNISGLVASYAANSALSIRRAMFASREAAHIEDIRFLMKRHVLLTWGFAILIVAWVASGVGSIYGLTTIESEPSIIKIQGDVDVRLE